MHIIYLAYLAFSVEKSNTLMARKGWFPAMYREVVACETYFLTIKGGYTVMLVTTGSTIDCCIEHWQVMLFHCDIRNKRGWLGSGEAWPIFAPINHLYD